MLSFVDQFLFKSVVLEFGSNPNSVIHEREDYPENTSDQQPRKINAFWTFKVSGQIVRGYLVRGACPDRFCPSSRGRRVLSRHPVFK